MNKTESSALKGHYCSVCECCHHDFRSAIAHIEYRIEELHNILGVHESALIKLRDENNA